jgi:3-methyladenine DNA glycosylase AlkD
MARAAEAARWLDQLRISLERQGTPARALQEKRYLKSELEFLGVTVPIIRREALAFVRARPELDRRALRRLAEAAWRSRVHELRSVVIGILERRSSDLTSADATWLIRLVESSDTWAHVDWLSIRVIGALTARSSALDATLDRWARHPSFWVRRAALLSFHDALRAGEGELDHFARLAVPMLGEPELFIRKAIGWVLRSASLARPDQVVSFVAQHAAALSALSFREATRRLPAAARLELEAQRALAAKRSLTTTVRTTTKARRATTAQRGSDGAPRRSAPRRAGKRARRAAP